VTIVSLLEVFSLVYYDYKLLISLVAKSMSSHLECLRFSQTLMKSQQLIEQVYTSILLARSLIKDLLSVKPNLFCDDMLKLVNVA
jgi:hypothetical protein